MCNLNEIIDNVKIDLNINFVENKSVLLIDDKMKLNYSDYFEEKKIQKIKDIIMKSYDLSNFEDINIESVTIPIKLNTKKVYCSAVCCIDKDTYTNYRFLYSYISGYMPIYFHILYRPTILYYSECIDKFNKDFDMNNEINSITNITLDIKSDTLYFHEPLSTVGGDYITGKASEYLERFFPSLKKNIDEDKEKYIQIQIPICCKDSSDIMYCMITKNNDGNTIVDNVFLSDIF